jgi:hypothetical protein
MAIDVTFSLVDDYARSASKRFEGEATTLVQAAIDAGSLMTDFLAVSGMGTTLVTYRQAEVENNAASTGANLDAGATIHCRLENGKGYAFKIPAIKSSLLNPDGTVNISDAAITDFVANFQLSGPYRVSEGNYVVSILSGELDR